MSLPDDLFGPEEPESANKPSWFSKLFSSVAVWIAVWAMVVAVICFVLALNARNEIHYAQRRIDDMVRTINESRETVKAFQTQFRVLEDRLDQQQRLFSGRLSESVNLNRALEAAVRQSDERIGVLEELTREGFEEVSRRLAGSPPPGLETVSRPDQELTESDATVEEEPLISGEEDRVQQTYAVRPGDNMTSIARRFNVRLDHLIEANPEINPDVLRVGQMLRIPAQDD